MKNSLEYKVLKYLADNDIGEHIDIAHLFENESILRRVLRALRKQDFIDWFTKVGHNGNRNKEMSLLTFSGLKYLESLKPKPLTLFQKIQLFTTILSICVAVTFGILNYLLSLEKSELKDENFLLESDIVRYKDSINLYKQRALSKKLLIDQNTSQPKNLTDLKTETDN